MCELLVRVRDKPLSGRVALDSQRTRRGDVVVCVHDGWAWSHEERTAPQWLIVQVPGMTVEEGIALTTPEPRADSRKSRRAPLRFTHKRLFYLDLDALVGPYAGRREAEVVRRTVAEVRAAHRQKVSLSDPNVIG